MPLSTWIEVDLDRFAGNLRAIRETLGANRDLLLVIKADAYGHGAREIAHAAAGEGVSRFGVATLHEGLQLRASGLTSEIVVLSPLLPAEIGEAVAQRLEPTIGDVAGARALSQAAQAMGRPGICHVEIDTGMGRTGVRDEEAESFLGLLRGLPGVRVASAWTHFPDADADDLAFTHEQLARFNARLERLAAHGLRPPRAHAANSAGMVALPGASLDWARIGLLAYGHVAHAGRPGPQVAPLMSLRSRIVQLREHPAGATISYARTWRAARPSRIGVVPVGYGHGYSWLLSNRGAMLVRGRHVPIVGRVTMDLTMVDVTEVPGVEPGDEVVLFGEQGAAAIGVHEVATWSETLPYEILCTIGKRVARLYHRRGRVEHLTTLVGERELWTRAADAYVQARHAAAGGR